MSNLGAGALSVVFKNDEILLLQSLHGKRIQQVIHHIWVNRAKAGAEVKSLEWIEFVVKPGHSVHVAMQEEEDLLRVGVFDIQAEKAYLKTHFGDMLWIESVEASQSLVWADPIRETLLEVKLHELRPGLFANEAMVLVFETFKVLVKATSEGIQIEPIEEYE